jgi:ribonuclease BN (tRNA processing enzyme)
MRHELVVNGLDNAWIREFGCACARCARTSRVANTSISLLSFEGSSLVHHVLFDVGAGVRDSLSRIEALRLQSRLDQIVLSHWHSDHTCELAPLSKTWARSRGRNGSDTKPVPVWARAGSAAWLERLYPQLEKAGLELQHSNEFEPIGTLLKPITLELPDVTLTPVTLSHHTADIHPDGSDNPWPCCSGFVLEMHALKQPSLKVAFLWDTDVSNTWLEHPNSAQRAAFEKLRHADHVFFDCNTWEYTHNSEGKPASHISFGMVQRFAAALEPKHSWLVHISGHEDIGDGFGWDDATWQREAQRIWRERKLPGQVRVPLIGEVIRLKTQSISSTSELVSDETARVS